jgi:acylphosphatase
MMKHLDILIIGDLKNAAFAFLTIRAASEYNISGFVGYTVDKNIFIEAEGYDPQLEKFIEWCKKEKSGAEIKKVITKNGKIQNYKKFEMEVGEISGRQLEVGSRKPERRG